ncbi:hypothetical protein EGW08_022553 [Elysia chlorotica]|uniref:Major facilitator superfamily (MFS) profile domain-containing protein n=1 Tax=Elysia chlorotica TaxID=188477 RepID=A0A433SKN6_ELYCH|nr:hypothetical protein EGW08_022553 [Elysia chlorotica]
MTQELTTIEQIYDQIGGLSWFHLIIILLTEFSKLMLGWSMMIMSYAGFINDFECIIPTNGTLYNGQDQAPNSTALNVCSVSGTACEDFRFLGSKRTVISEWHLVCDLRWMKAAIISVQMGGVLVGNTLGGLSGDFFGRRNTLYVAMVLHTFISLIGAYSASWQMFAVTRFFAGLLIGVMLMMDITLLAELLPMRWRHLGPVIPAWPLGVMVFAGVAAVLEDWAQLHIACAVLSALFCLGYFYVPESPRWLATQGRLGESHAVLEKIASMNNRSLPESAMDVIQHIANEEKTRYKGKKYTYKDLFINRATTKLTVIFSLEWMVMSIIFYGLNFGVSSFVGNLYLNIFLMNVIQLPASLATFAVIDRFGRRLSSIIFMVLATVASFGCVAAYLAAPESVRGEVTSALCLTALLLVSASWCTATVWVTDSYPTVIRSLGFGFASMSARAGAILAPFIINLDQFPLFTYILMGVMSLVCVVAISFLTETSDKVMAETVFNVQADSIHSNTAPALNSNSLGENQDVKLMSEENIRKSPADPPINRNSNGIDKDNVPPVAFV